MKSLLHGAVWTHGVRSDAEWARKQADNIRALRARYGRDVKVHIADTTHVAYVNDGRWVLDCPCGSGVLVDLEMMSARCHECGAVYTSQTMVLPPDADAIEAELIKRLTPRTRNWVPSESVADLQRENAMHNLTDGTPHERR